VNSFYDIHRARSYLVDVLSDHEFHHSLSGELLALDFATDSDATEMEETMSSQEAQHNDNSTFTKADTEV
jgi:hypothetical protein